jgi:hypothetical protein
VIDPVPVHLAGELHQLKPHVDNLVEPRSEQIAYTNLAWSVFGSIAALRPDATTEHRGDLRP